jgi:hypothetical protein
MGNSAASLTTLWGGPPGPRPTPSSAPTNLDFALIGHQESWRAAADVLAVLR